VILGGQDASANELMMKEITPRVLWFWVARTPVLMSWWWDRGYTRTTSCWTYRDKQEMCRTLVSDPAHDLESGTQRWAVSLSKGTHGRDLATFNFLARCTGNQSSATDVQGSFGGHVEWVSWSSDVIVCRLSRRSWLLQRDHEALHLLASGNFLPSVSFVIQRHRYYCLADFLSSTVFHCTLSIVLFPAFDVH